jgi:hypothetical protein
MILRPMAGGLHRVEVFGERWVIRVKKMLGPGGLGIFFGFETHSAGDYFLRCL